MAGPPVRCVTCVRRSVRRCARRRRPRSARMGKPFSPSMVFPKRTSRACSGRFARTMIDHVSVYVDDIDAAKAFYVKALEPLGYTVIREFAGMAIGMGVAPKPDLW